MSTKRIMYFEPDAVLIRPILKEARGLGVGEELQVYGVSESRHSGFYQNVYNYVFLNLEGYGEFEQFPTLDGLMIRREK